MSTFNKVILMGNLTRDPQVRYTPGGTAVTELGLALNRQWFDKQTNSRREETTFVDVTLWGRQAEVASEYLSKGRQVLIEGRLQLDQWDDKESGQRRSKLKVVAESMRMVGGRSESSSGGSPPPEFDDSQGGNDDGPSSGPRGGGGPSGAGAIPDDDVPF